MWECVLNKIFLPEFEGLSSRPKALLAQQCHLFLLTGRIGHLRRFSVSTFSHCFKIQSNSCLNIHQNQLQPLVYEFNNEKFKLTIDKQKNVEGWLYFKHQQIWWCIYILYSILLYIIPKCYYIKLIPCYHLYNILHI